jgi:capsular exopolysaccharide synthesis family protein
VERLKNQLSQTKSERIKLETEYQQFEKSKDNLAALLTIPFIANNPTVMQMKNNVTAKQSEVATIDQRYKAKHYKYIEAHSQLAELNNALRQTILDSGQTLRLAFGNAINAEKALQESLDKEQSSAIGLSRVAMDYKALATQAESDRALYQSFLNRMKETSVAKDLGTSKIHIIQNAEAADAPSKPQAARMYLLGAVAGLVIGLALALLLSLTDSSLKSLDEAEEYLRMPTLSTVPQLKSGQLDSTQLVMGQNAVMSGAESFRSLRTSLGLLNNRGDHKIYLFTSAMPEEGKTFCSMNYAYSLAQQGLRVLLIDCDLRRPSIERCLCGTIGQMSGVSDFLNGKQSFKDIVFDTGIPNYYFVPAGTPVGNPSELLAQDRMNALIQEGLNHFDRIVLDSAPIFGVSDTLLMTGRTHVACLVVRACKTPRKKVLRAVQILQNAGAPLVGMILNRLPADGRRNADDPYYDYGYTSERATKIVPLLPSTNSPSPSQDADKEISASQTT